MSHVFTHCSPQGVQHHVAVQGFLNVGFLTPRTYKLPLFPWGEGPALQAALGQGGVRPDLEDKAGQAKLEKGLLARGLGLEAPALFWRGGGCLGSCGS